MIYQNEVSFVEKPASEDELLIANVMENLFEAMVHHDSGKLLSLFSDDAEIYSTFDNKFVSRTQYAKRIKLIWSLTRIFQLFDLLIRVEGETAVVFGFSRYFYNDGSGKVWGRKWKLRKGHSGWLITESLFYPA